MFKPLRVEIPADTHVTVEHKITIEQAERLVRTVTDSAIAVILVTAVATSASTAVKHIVKTKIK